MLWSCYHSPTIRSHDDYKTAFPHKAFDFHLDFRFFLILSTSSFLLLFLLAMLKFNLPFYLLFFLSIIFVFIHF